MKLNLFYMARPPYGGWVSFTAHLALKHDLPLFKVGNKTEAGKDGEPKLRDFGYGVQYQNRAIGDLPAGKILITAIDKTYYEDLDKMPDGSYIVIHDPTEITGKGTEPVLRNLKRFKVVTIRESVKKFLKDHYDIKSKFILHPFHEYDFQKSKSPHDAVSISRIDFDKHTDIILKANKKLDNPVKIYGAINRQYVFFKLKDLGFQKYFKGGFEKSFDKLSEILKDAKYVVDMSVIKHDGGGSQYTFLEAMYQGCALVLNRRWIENQKTNFVSGKNCFVVGDEEELTTLLDRDPPVGSVLRAARALLQPHIDVNWLRELARL
jgi:hypothetical protein